MGMAITDRERRQAERQFTNMLIRLNLQRAVRARRKASETLAMANTCKLNKAPALGYCRQTESDLIQAIRRAENHLGREHRKFSNGKNRQRAKAKAA